MEVDISGAKVFFTIPIDFPLFGKIQISETLVVSWIVMALITGLCIWLTRDLKIRNISKRQAVAEMIVETANKFVIGNIEADATGKHVENLFIAPMNMPWSDEQSLSRRGRIELAFGQYDVGIRVPDRIVEKRRNMHISLRCRVGLK